MPAATLRWARETTMNETPTDGRRLPSGTLLPALLAALMLLASLLPGLHEAGESRLDDAAGRAVAAFAVARTINGIISVVQEMQFGVSLGINTAVQPGEILDPLNDLIERFSTAALIAATILWALKLAGGLLLLPWLPLVLLLLIGLRVALARLDCCADLGRLLMGGVRVGVVLWLFAVLTPWVISAVHDSGVVQEPYREATARLDAAGDRLRGLVDVGSPFDVDRDRLLQGADDLLSMADDLAEQAIIVLAVFAFEVLVVPLVIFWITARLVLRPAQGPLSSP
jgi:hypothetical protein